MASPWATPEELRLHLRLATIDAEQAAVKLAEAETVIRGELEQSIDAVADDTAVLVGTGRRVLTLPELPVTAVTTVLVDDAALTLATGYRWNRYGLLTRLDGCWPLDADITVVYSHGYTVIPPVIRQVCLQVAGRAWVRSTTAVTAESLGDRSLTYDKDRSGQALSDYELRILRPYMRGPASR
ncbi:hypothetical protein LUW75_10865 [Streptomyces sp. MRC013]|uniref:hypothetical protein n=1 Tax=Streptomyces sp. MRC013 TaxID=2898276 RepID=UPI002025E4CA|nr:hypothetical protein [Streptomyces sp. MRC013]URM90414.1 hypothetical protein LUW75_10865 [Streptomyces sp. MRC013]